MQKKTILITGANSGIGLAAAGQLAQKGANVVITTRSEAKALGALREIKERYGQDVDYLLLELDDLDSVRRCAEAFNDKYPRLDVLINNAGLSLSDRLETAQGFEYVLGVNHVGPFLLTQLLLDKLKASAPARIVCLSSAAHVGARKGIDWDDLQRQKKFSGQAYCQVKLGTIYWVKEMAERYRDSNISAFAVNPGFVSTQFAMDGDTHGAINLFFKLGKIWMAKPDKGAATTVWAAMQPEIESLSGEYLQNCARHQPTSFADDAQAAKRWWELSERWVQDMHP